LWIGTQFGLSRFDGNHFLNYSQNGPKLHRLSSVDVRGIVEDSTELWVLPGGDGIDEINLATFRVVQNRRIGYDGVMEFGLSLANTREKLWIGTSSALRMYDKKTKTFTILSKNATQSAKGQYFNVRCLFTDLNGNVWAFYTGYGIEIFNGKTGKKIKRIPIEAFSENADEDLKLRFNNCIDVQAGQLLIGTTGGLRMIYYDSNYAVRVQKNPIRSLDSLNHNAVEGLCRLSSGNVMISSMNQLFCFDAGLKSYSIWKDFRNTVEGDWLSAVQQIHADENDNIWLGCQQGLAYIPNRPCPFQPYFFEQVGGFKLDHVRSVLPLGNGELIVGLRSGAVRIDQKTRKFNSIDQSETYHHIFESSNGDIIFCKSNGLFIQTKGKIEPLAARFPEFQPFESYPINSHLRIGDSIIVLGTENSQGILIWNQNRHSVRQIFAQFGEALQSDVVNNIYLDHKERLWILSDHYITILSKKWKPLIRLTIKDKARNTEIQPFFDVCEANGFYWIAAYGTGIIQMDSNLRVLKTLNTDSGLSNSGVYQIFHSGNSLIVTTDYGLSVLDLATGKFKLYYSQDGLHSNAFEEVAGTMKNNLVYAGGVQGLTVVDPAKFGTNKIPPKVYISGIVIDRENKKDQIDSTNLNLASLEIPNDAIQTRFYFSGINYSDPNRTTFEYRIRENGAWTNNGTDNSVSLIGLLPGTYHFEVKAANEDGYWSEPATLTLIYLPKWYQTWWFKVLIGLAVVGAGYGFYRMRINQILKQQKIRRDLASDLHDDIGSSLNSIKVFAHLASADPLRKEYIRNVETNLEQATVGLRDMLWILDDKLDTIGDLRQRLHQYAARPAEAVGINVTFKIDEGLEARMLTKTVKRNLYMVAKEAINNSVKYADCKSISLSFAFRQKKLILHIRDDGKGFDVENNSAGYGLSNMKHRAGQIHFDFHVHSNSAGTNISVIEK
jgi:ligand-binding sensor domain-containing protein